MKKTKTKKKANKPTENKDVKKRNVINDKTKEQAFLYYSKGLTCKEVAKLLDLSFRTVQNWQTSEKWSEKMNPNNIKEKCYELKSKGITHKEISKMLNISISSVQRYIKEYKEKNEQKKTDFNNL